MSTLDLPNQWYAYGPTQLFAYNDIIVLNYLKSKKYENENNSNKSEKNQSLNACTKSNRFFYFQEHCLEDHEKHRFLKSK